MKATDLTNGRPLKLIFLYSLPIIVGNIFQTFYSAADTAIVGRFAGLERLAAVGATGSLSFFIFGFLYGLTGGFSITIAQRRGAKDWDGLRKAEAHAVMLTAALVLLVTAISVPLARPMLRLMNTPEDIMSLSVSYLSIIFAGTVFSATYNLTASILRAVGDSRTPLYFLIFSSLLNSGLDIHFIVPLKMDVAGAAIATILSQGVSGFLCVIYAFRRYPELRLRKSDFRIDRGMISTMLRLGLPMALQSSITAAGMIILQSALNGFGSTTVAGYTAANKVESFVTMPGFALSTSMANFAGQNVGAKKYGRVRTGVRCGCWIILVWATISSLFCLYLAMPVMRLFVTGDPVSVWKTLEAGQTFLTILAWFFLPFNALFIFRSTLQGIGKSIYTLIGGIIEMVMRVAVAFLLPGVLGFAGVCLAGPAAWIGADIVLIIAYFHEIRKFPKEDQPDPLPAEA
ncbi:MAG: MATE family efflux transporter [Clostridia bacterium]|nr:MATE family efflux transporter [Clostridia bacterium]